MKLHALGCIISMRILDGLDHELEGANMSAKKSGLGFCIFLIFLKICVDVNMKLHTLGFLITNWCPTRVPKKGNNGIELFCVFLLFLTIYEDVSYESSIFGFYWFYEYSKLGPTRVPKQIIRTMDRIFAKMILVGMDAQTCDMEHAWSTNLVLM